MNERVSLNDFSEDKEKRAKILGLIIDPYYLEMITDVVLKNRTFAELKARWRVLIDFGVSWKIISLVIETGEVIELGSERSDV